jgi:hypothetical protein
MSCVYKVELDDELYIGSTTNIRLRKNNHKHRCYNDKSSHYNNKLYQLIREKYKWEDVDFQILEQHETRLENKELIKREQQFIERLNPTLNSKRAFRTAEQKRLDKNANAIKQRQVNKDKYILCPCGGKYKTNHNRHYNTNRHIEYLDNLN